MLASNDNNKVPKLYALGVWVRVCVCESVNKYDNLGTDNTT